MPPADPDSLIAAGHDGDALHRALSLALNEALHDNGVLEEKLRLATEQNRILTAQNDALIFDSAHDEAFRLREENAALKRHLAEARTDLRSWQDRAQRAEQRVDAQQTVIDNAFERAQRTCDELGHDDLDDEQFFVGPSRTLIGAAECLDEDQWAATLNTIDALTAGAL